MEMLKIHNLHVATANTEILKGLDLVLEKGKVYVLMGPNGSGKSTLAQTLLGHPNYEITQGDILIEGSSIKDLSPSERAKKGLFLSFQYPQEVSGVPLSNFLREAYNTLHPENKLSLLEFQRHIQEQAQKLQVPADMITRYVNVGFSGGEKKKSEMLQLLTLNPNLAILDETDSGLDIDALRIVAKGIKTFVESNPEKTVLIITHYKRLLDYLDVDKVFIMKKGSIVEEGTKELIDKLESQGYGDDTQIPSNTSQERGSD